MVIGQIEVILLLIIVNYEFKEKDGGKFMETPKCDWVNHHKL